MDAKFQGYASTVIVWEWTIMCAHERQRYESFQIKYNSCAPEGTLVESQPLQGGETHATFCLLLFKANCSMRRIRQSGIEIERLYASEPVQLHLCASWRRCPSLRMFPQIRGTKDHPVRHVHIDRAARNSIKFLPQSFVRWHEKRQRKAHWIHRCEDGCSKP